MKKYIVKSLLLAIIPIAMLLCIEETLLRKIPDDYSYKNNYLETHAASIEILSLGSSHGYYGVEPSLFRRPAFNAGHVSQTFRFDYEILNKYSDRLISLQTVILPVSYFSYWEDLEESKERFRVSRYHTQYDISSVRIQSRIEALNMKPANCIKRLVSFYLNGHDEIEADSLGFGIKYGIEARDTNWKTLCSYVADRHKISDLTLHLESNRHYLRKLLQLCCEREIRVVLVHLPMYEGYRNLLDKKQLIEMKALTCEISREFPDVQVVDLFKDNRFGEDDFFDPDHLNQDGARKLTRILDQYLSETI